MTDDTERIVNGHRLEDLGQPNPYVPDRDARCIDCGLTTRGTIDPFREEPCNGDTGTEQAESKNADQ